jgi:SNF2 family DNA or RNA helicase
VPLFLISLKASDTGLTLTAAERLFIMIPDGTRSRARRPNAPHRIGQDKPVFVYSSSRRARRRRVLELQQRKKALAAGIYEAGGNAATALDATDTSASSSRSLDWRNAGFRPGGR